jgi:hypothetical protein
MTVRRMPEAASLELWQSRVKMIRRRLHASERHRKESGDISGPRRDEFCPRFIANSPDLVGDCE